MQMLYFLFPFREKGGWEMKVHPGADHVEARKNAKRKLNTDALDSAPVSAGLASGVGWTRRGDNKTTTARVDGIWDLEKTIVTQALGHERLLFTDDVWRCLSFPSNQLYYEIIIIIV